MFWTNERREKRVYSYVFTISCEERKDKLNASINRSLSRRFEQVSSVDRFYLTTLFV